MYRIFIILVLLPFFGNAQTKIELHGKVRSNGKVIPFANIFLAESTLGTSANIDGEYSLNVPPETIEITIQAVGYKTLIQTINAIDYKNKPLNFSLKEDMLGLDQIVISATRNRVNKTETPVVVNVLSKKLFNATQSISVAESLNFQPGVRVETNCQNCGFTQVRLNGLDGSYTQVLINSRAVFSALNSVYGLEQIPTSILDRIEVIRSGGSALYGSNAIAGTINIITKDPVLNSWEMAGNLRLITGKVADRTLNLNASVVSEDLTQGITIFGMRRNRDSYDANNDGFTEITKLNNTTLGAKAFLIPSEKSKITLDFTALEEYRRGGNQLNLLPHLTDITEELDHNTYLGGITYDLQNEDATNQFSVYTSTQYTDRKSYYGGLGGGRTHQDSILASNAYGKTDDFALLTGSQFTRNFTNEDVLTVGAEYNLNKVEDNIPGYNRSVNQEVHSLGTFAQYEWKPVKKFTTLIGSRFDYVSVSGNYTIQEITRKAQIHQAVFSPRFTVLYNFIKNWQFRGGYARGFRAPQAFNEDLHISSVGGEPRFVILSENLETEYSNAYTASLNFTKDFSNIQTNFLLEGFYTDLQNPFTTISTGASLPNGSILQEVKNGNGAYVSGFNFEIGLSPSSNFTFQMGGTFQNSRYKKAQLLYEAEAENENIFIDEFVRNPNLYGYLNSTYNFTEETSVSITGTYTGKMIVPKVINSDGFLRLNESDPFYDINLKLSHHIDFTERFQMTFSGGIQNIFNSYQDDFDSGAQRDSDYIFGPSRPRTFFFGIKFGNLHN